MKANDEQFGGNHYKGTVCPHCGEGLEHWDLAWLYQWDCFQYIITKWVMRWRSKGGVMDLRKARHAIDKYLEVAIKEEQEKLKELDKLAGEVSGGQGDEDPGPGYVNQDPDIESPRGLINETLTPLQLESWMARGATILRRDDGWLVLRNQLATRIGRVRIAHMNPSQKKRWTE